jgi:hypothetical protein
VKPLLKYGPSCRALNVLVGGAVVLASERVVACWTVAFDNKGIEVEFWYDADTVDELLTEIVRPQAMPKQ